jgi:hypothetical protein
MPIAIPWPDTRAFFKRGERLQDRFDPRKANFDLLESRFSKLPRSSGQHVPGLNQLTILGFRARCLVGRLARALVQNVFSKFPNETLSYYLIRGKYFQIVITLVHP